MNTKSSYLVAKRGLDVLAAAGGLAVLSPVLAVVAMAVKLSSPGPVVFRHERVGRKLKTFKLLKFRTMVDSASGLSVTAKGDPRVTATGRFLRRYKLDELPQLFNILKGDMSLVGPRPEVRKYVELFRKDYDRILTIRPGLTDFAAIEYRDEESILSQNPDPEAFYVDQILPAKIRLYDEYLARQSFATDLQILAQTLRALVR
jgi:lipopolysaccharide/colanic/teichoic acid biosynthesis glycosyltransferase